MDPERHGLGVTLRLKHDATGLKRTEQRTTCIAIEAGELVRVQRLALSDKLIYVEWKGKSVLMFTNDLLTAIPVHGHSGPDRN
jgi:hypothetical protein